MQLKPQDIVILLKIFGAERDWNYRSIAQALFMSIGEVHNGLNRATIAQLYDAIEKRPRLQALEEFLVHGLKYAFPAERGSVTRGMPTGYAAPPLSQIFAQSVDDYPPVWPDPEGSTRGYKLAPLYDSVPQAAKQDKDLYELLALVDAIRDGRARERKLAAEQLHSRLRGINAKT